MESPNIFFSNHVKFPPADVCIYFYTLHRPYTCRMQYLHIHHVCRSDLATVSLVTFLWHCRLRDGKKPFRELLHFQSPHLSTRTHQSWLTCCRNYFWFKGFCRRTACHSCSCLPLFPSCVVYHLFSPLSWQFPFSLSQTRRGCPPTWASLPVLNVRGYTGSWESTTPGSSPSLWTYSAPQSSW